MSRTPSRPRTVHAPKCVLERVGRLLGALRRISRNETPQINAGEATEPRAYGPIWYSSASDSEMLFGAAKPWSRPQYWQFTVVPTTVSDGDGLPPSVPTAKAFMSIEYVPEQSSGGGGAPLDVSVMLRRNGALMHRTPPPNGPAACPVVP
jgi:hypothetical protein